MAGAAPYAAGMMRRDRAGRGAGERRRPWARRAAAGCAALLAGTQVGVSRAGAQVSGGPGAEKPLRPAAADSAAHGVHLAFTATLATDYVNRGVSQTAGRPQYSAGLEAGYRGLYAGATAFHVDFRREQIPRTNTEIDLYAGYAAEPVGQVLDLGVIRYTFTPQPSGLPRVSYAEVYGKTARALGPVTAGASAYYSGNGMSGAGASWYGVVTAAWQLAPRWSVSGLGGRQTVHVGGSYDDWNGGTSYKATPALTLDLRYWNTNGHALGRDYHGRVVASANVSP